MNKAIDIIFIIVFLIIISIPMGGTIFVDKAEMSMSEKRKLATFPKLDANSKRIKAFPEAFSAYVNDHFLFRSELVEFNSMLRVKTLKTSPSMAVAIGKDGWLFALMDWVLHDFLGTKRLSQQELITWKKAILQRKELLSNWDGHYLHVIVPNKISMYPENAPDRLRNRMGQTRLEQFTAYAENEPELKDIYMDLTPTLDNGKKDIKMYFQTDTHWTTAGSFLGYQSILQHLNKIGLSVRPFDQTKITPITKQGVSGDLAKIMGARDYLKENSPYYVLNTPCAASASTKIEYPLPDKVYTLKKNGCKDGAPMKVILISDSFGNSLVRYLNETFQEMILDGHVKFLDLIPFLKQHKPDLVIRVSVARFMHRSFFYDPDLETNF